MKVLSIGNSFSQDAQHYLHQVAECEGVDIECVNLFVGGCSLQRHWEHWLSGEAAYVLERNGTAQRNADDTDVRYISLQEALGLEIWDAVTFQQVSGLSGRSETFQPYLRDLVAVVRARCPQARCYMHQTWAYDAKFTGQQFAEYHFDQQEMIQRLRAAYEQAAAEMKMSVIPCGDVIQALRGTETFHAISGLSLNRDGTHISYTLGRYALAVVWYATLTGQAPQKDFVPPDSKAEDEPRRALIRSTILPFLYD